MEIARIIISSNPGFASRLLRNAVRGSETEGLNLLGYSQGIRIPCARCGTHCTNLLVKNATLIVNLQKQSLVK
jgi:hypothetical protein